MEAHGRMFSERFSLHDRMPVADSELQASQHCGKGLAGWALDGYLQVVRGALNKANLSLRKGFRPFFSERNTMFTKKLGQAFGLFFAS